MMNPLRSMFHIALEEAAVILGRPEVAEDLARAFLAALVEDHDFRGAPRTKDWVKAHRQPTHSPDSQYINELTEWACNLEREQEGKK